MYSYDTITHMTLNHDQFIFHRKGKLEMDMHGKSKGLGEAVLRTSCAKQNTRCRRLVLISFFKTKEGGEMTRRNNSQQNIIVLHYSTIVVIHAGDYFVVVLNDHSGAITFKRNILTAMSNFVAYVLTELKWQISAYQQVNGRINAVVKKLNKNEERLEDYSSSTKQKDENQHRSKFSLCVLFTKTHTHVKYCMNSKKKSSA